jgi:hypothetical protein
MSGPLNDSHAARFNQFSDFVVPFERIRRPAGGMVTSISIALERSRPYRCSLGDDLGCARSKTAASSLGDAVAVRAMPDREPYRGHV